jgi:type IV pilus assembly protein PilC
MAIKLDNYTLPKTQSGATSKPKPNLDIESWLKKDIQLFETGMGAKQKKSLYTELSVLLSAGLDIQRALLLIEQGLGKKNHKATLATIRERIVAGAPLSTALEGVGGFSAYETMSIKIGEETGRLTIVLNELASFFAKTLKYRQQLMGALAYPVFVTLFAFSVVFFLLKYLVPMFSDVYKRFDSELPAITQYIISLSACMKAWSPVLMLGFAGFCILLFLWRKKEWLRKLSALLILRMPLFGDIIRNIYLARFCQSMSLLLGAKVSLLRAVDLVRQMSAFHPLEVSLARVEKDIVAGKSLNESLSAFAFYPPQLIALLRVGEETGKLEEMFGNLANQYNDSVDARTALIGSLLEPVLIIGLGILVGFILVAMYLPLFQMSTSVG